MSTSKNNPAGEAAAKHVSFTPAHSEAGDTARDRQPQGTSRKADQGQDGAEGGLEAQAKNWLGQQQWLQNIDVNQLSKQAKDLGSKAVEQVNRLSPTQKVVGGALLVSGLSWLALRSASNKSRSSAAASHDDSDNDDTWQRSSESVYRGRTTKTE